MLRVFGIRHHGPGSARSVAAALDEYAPDVVLVEGPPEGDELIAIAADPGLVPPVALMIYEPEAAGRFVFYPFARFSPEWQAIRHALARGVPVRFCDAPAGAHPDFARDENAGAEAHDDVPREDPLATLAAAAGYGDAESFWDALVEQRRDSTALFEALIELFAAAREQAPSATRPHDLAREAAMRQVVRVEMKAGRERIAVVCGAWHAPVIDPAPFTVKSDQELLRALPKRKLAATWVPWSYSRLDMAGGYGAGVRSPAWYEHVHDVREHAAERFAVSAARCFRDAGIEIGPAHAIEAARLAHALAAMRNLPAPGLDELGDAIMTVFGDGDARGIALVRETLVVGTSLGQVPEHVPTAPLLADLTREAKRLRMPMAAAEKSLDLDLREDNARERSALLHRLRALGVPWGEQQRGGQRARGTFNEHWTLRWDPGYVVKLAENVRHGNTIATATATRLLSLARDAKALPEVRDLLSLALLAALPDALPELLQRFDALAAATSDVPTLMQSVPALLDLGRYGDVRGTDTTAAATVATHLVERVAIGLPLACAGPDDAAAATLVAALDECDQALRRSRHEAEDWTAALLAVADNTGSHALLAGRATRLLLDRGAIDAADAARRLGLALSPAVAAMQAAWIEGLLGGSGLLLIHEPALLGLVDAWLAALPSDRFSDVLPLLRRAFSSFSMPERRQIGERVRGGVAAPAASAVSLALDEARVALVLPRLLRYLGVEPEAKS